MSETSGRNTGIYLIYSRPHFPIILESLIVPSTLYLHPRDLQHYCSTIFLLKNKKVSIRLLWHRLRRWSPNETYRNILGIES